MTQVNGLMPLPKGWARKLDDALHRRLDAIDDSLMGITAALRFDLQNMKANETPTLMKHYGLIQGSPGVPSQVLGSNKLRRKLYLTNAGSYPVGMSDTNTNCLQGFWSMLFPGGPYDFETQSPVWIINTEPNDLFLVTAAEEVYYPGPTGAHMSTGGLHTPITEPGATPSEPIGPSSVFHRS